MKDALGSVQSVLVLGGGSDIALATVRELVQRRARTIVLAARDPEALDRHRRASCRGRAPTRVETVAFDARDTDVSTTRSSTTCSTASATSTSRILAFGVLGDQEEAEHDGRRRGRHRRGELRRLGVGDGADRAAHARAGSRHDRGALVGRRRAGPPLELRLRLVEGGHGRLLPGPRRQRSWAPACR